MKKTTIKQFISGQSYDSYPGSYGGHLEYIIHLETIWM